MLAVAYYSIATVIGNLFEWNNYACIHVCCILLYIYIVIITEHIEYGAMQKQWTPN